jgi:hypothetical protein
MAVAMPASGRHRQDAHIGAPQNEFGSLLATLVGRPS